MSPESAGRTAHRLHPQLGLGHGFSRAASSTLATTPAGGAARHTSLSPWLLSPTSLVDLWVPHELPGPPWSGPPASAVGVSYPCQGGVSAGPRTHGVQHGQQAARVCDSAGLLPSL